MFVFLLFISDYESNVLKKVYTFLGDIFCKGLYGEFVKKKEKKDHHYFKKDHTDLWKYECKKRNEG